MSHPELVYLAAERCHIPVVRVIHDAFERKRLYISARTLSSIHDSLMHRGVVPEMVEDYALDLLAKHERETRLPNSYDEWIRR